MKQTDALIADTLSRIVTLTKKHSRRVYEKSNILHDLAVMENRIETGQYKETDFLLRNTFDTGRRTEEFLHYMEGYIHQADQWSKILKPVLRNNTIHTITDICPGWAPKIEIALATLEYTGTVIVFDKNNTSTKQLRLLLAPHKSAFTMVAKTGDVLSTSKKPQSDLTVCNHIVDDVLLSLYARSEKISLDQIYLSEELFLHAINNIIHDTIIRTNFPDIFAGQINRFIPHNGICIMTHYPAVNESSLRLKAWTTFCYSMIKNIYSKLVTTGYTPLNVRGISQKVPDLFILQKSTHSTPRSEDRRYAQG